MTWDPTADAWAAGFIDGEGYFRIAKQMQRMAGAFVPIFGIGLRIDEVPIITTLHAAFGGSIAYKPAVGAAKPTVQWTVSGKADLMRVVEYLDRFPLRAKKARDYAIWREAVHAYVRAGGRAEQLGPLCEALTEVRRFDDRAHPRPPGRSRRRATA